tara:strand:- start:48 stop:848 length:801 start_codon:yes stop_codon:yes gene_type:complete
MKRFILLVFSVLLTFSFAIAQDGINYQGAATDANGDELTNQNITIRASVLSGSVSGNLEWEETHSATTDQFGLFNVVIGQGTNTTNGATATFDDMDWGAANHFLKIEMDATGGTNYAMIGTTQMMSVPYALYAKNAGSVEVGHFYQTFSCPSLQYAGSSTTTYLVDSLTINTGGLVFVEGDIDVHAPSGSCSTRMTVVLKDEFGNTIPINCYLPFDGYVSTCANSVSNTQYRSGSFMASSNQKIYIYGVCERSGVGSGSFDIGIFK